MSVIAVFDVPDMNQEKYDNVMKDLNMSQENKPNGLISHVCSAKEAGGMQVVDVWDSPENFATFGEKLMPVLIKNGVTPPQPQISMVHNLIK
jgi:hypothetical protein